MGITIVICIAIAFCFTILLAIYQGLEEKRIELAETFLYLMYDDEEVLEEENNEESGEIL